MHCWIRNYLITNCSILNQTVNQSDFVPSDLFTGITDRGSGRLFVMNCSILGYYHSGIGYYTNHAVITNNRVTNTRYGIYVGGSDSDISYNEISETDTTEGFQSSIFGSAAIWVGYDGSNSNSIHHNIIKGGGRGINLALANEVISNDGKIFYSLKRWIF